MTSQNFKMCKHPVCDADVVPGQLTSRAMVSKLVPLLVTTTIISLCHSYLLDNEVENPPYIGPKDKFLLRGLN